MAQADTWALFFACAFVAEVIGTVAGFGAATILTPVAVLFMDVKLAIALVAIFHFFGNASRLAFFGRHIRWSLWAQFGLAGILCSFAGARVAVTLSSAWVTLCVGAFLLSYVVTELWAAGRWRLPASPPALVVGGALSGFVAGLIGTGGAIRSACLLAFGLPKEVYLGTSAAIALVVDATRVPVYVLGGVVPAAAGRVAAGLVLTAFAGAWLGQRLARQLSSVGFRRLVLALLALAGMKLLLDGWSSLT
jgi:uncharacterized membrane protein YfcA